MLCLDFQGDFNYASSVLAGSFFFAQMKTNTDICQPSASISGCSSLFFSLKLQRYKRAIFFRRETAMMKEIRQSPSLGAQYFYFLTRARCRSDPACPRWMLMTVPDRDEIDQSAPGIEPLMRQFTQEHKMRDGKGAGGCCGLTGQTIQTASQSRSQNLLFSFRAVPRVQNQHNWSVRQSKEGLKWWVTEILFGRQTSVFCNRHSDESGPGEKPKKARCLPGGGGVIVIVNWLS